MPINIIERAVTPYNSSPNSLVNKEQYSMFAPGADIEKPGLAGFSAEFFAVAQQIVSLNARFLKTLLRHKVFTPDMDSSGAKEVNTLYSSFSAEVIAAFAPMDGTPRYTERTGSLLVLDGGDKQIEILFAEDGIWTRRVALPGYEATDFLPLHNMPVNGADILYNTIGTAQLIDGGVTTEKLADASVSQTKLSPSFVARVSAVERNVENLREISVVKTDTPSQIYATASDGSPAFLPYAETPTAYSVPQRDGAGRVKTASPASASDAVDFGSFSDEKERVGKLITDLQTAVNRLSRAFAFDTWEAALSELTKPALAEAKEKYRIGDAILIRDVEAPDGWVSGYADVPDPYPVGNNIQNPFDGTDAFTVGWLIISPLEAPKLSLDGYATTEEAKAFADAAEEEAKSYAAEEAKALADAAESEAKSYAAEEVAGVSDRVEILDKKVENLDKKVENLRAALSPEYFTTDSSVAYTKTVPAAALPFAEVQEVGGMTHKCNNLVKSVSSSTSNLNGITVERSVGASSVVVNGTSTKDQAITLVLLASFPRGEYTMSVIGLNSTDSLYIKCGSTFVTSGVKIDSPKTFTITESDTLSISATFVEGSSYSSKEVCLMLNKGTTALPYESYYDGLRNAAVTALETVGVNILDLTPALNANLTDNGDGTYTLRKTASGRFSERFPLYIPKGQHVFCYFEIVSTNIAGFKIIPFQLFGADKKANGSSIGIVNGGAAYAPTADTFFANAYLPDSDAVGAYVTFRNPMVQYQESGQAALPYAPYVKRTYPIPAEVQALEGWGLGVNETYHNRLDWGKKQYRQEVGTVDMGDLTYSMRVNNGRNIFGTSSLRDTIRGFAAGDAPLPAVAVGYRAVRVADTWVNGDMAYGNSTEGYTSIEFVNNAYTDAASFKEAMRGRKLVYALASPTVTDLPELPDDNFIEVEGGGTVTAVNEHELAAPTKIEYQLKEATA